MKEPPLKQLENEFDFFVQQISKSPREAAQLQEGLNQLRDLYQPANIQEEYYLEQIAEGQ